MRVHEAASFIGVMLIGTFVAAWPISLYGHIFVPDDYQDTNPHGDVACGVALLAAEVLIGFLYAYSKWRSKTGPFRPQQPS
jgi:hypothetical protein